MQCEPCPKGTYAIRQGNQASCAACPSGRTTLREGSLSREQCGEQGSGRGATTRVVSQLFVQHPEIVQDKTQRGFAFKRAVRSAWGPVAGAGGVDREGNYSYSTKPIACAASSECAASSLHITAYG